MAFADRLARIPAPDVLGAAATGAAVFGHVLLSADDFVGSGTDLVSMEAPLLDFGRRWVARGVLPWWNPLVAGGTPLPGATSGYLSPFFWLTLPLSLPLAIKLIAALALALAGAGAAWMARPFVTSRLASYACGALFAASGFLAAHLHAGHLELVATTAFMPWIVGIVDRLRRGARAPLPLAVATFACAILSAHYQLFAMSCLAAAALSIASEAAEPALPARARLARVAKPLGALVGLALAGALVAAVQVVPLAEVLPFTQRREADLGFASSFAAVPATWLEALLPRLFGPDAALASKGEFAPWEAWGYVGVATLALSAHAVATLPRRRWIAPAIAAGFGALLAMGDRTPVLRAVLFVLPPLGRFRAPGRYLVFVALFGALLAAMGLDATVSTEREARQGRRELAGPAAVVAVGLLLAWWLSSTDSGAFASTLSSLGPFDGADGATARLVLEHARDDAYLAVVLAGVCLGAVAAARDASRRVAAGRVAAIVAILDVVHAGRPLLATGPHATFEWLAPLAPKLQQALGPAGRLLPSVELRAPNAGVPYDLGAPTGYTVLFDDRAARYAKRAAGLAPETFLGVVQSDGSSPMLRHLGVSLVLTGRPRASADGAQALGMGAAHEVGGMGKLRVLALDAPEPRVALVHAAEVVDEPTAYARMAEASFDLRTAALLEPGAPPVTLAPPAPGASEAVDVTRYEPNRVSLRVEAAAAALAVLSDVDEPGWTATVDGASAPVLPVDRVMRGVPVPAGHHDVVMSYRPPGLVAGIALSLAGLALLVLLAVRDARRARYLTRSTAGFAGGSGPAKATQ